MTDSVVGREAPVSTLDGGPELVQLLTPEGERVEHPDYALRRAPDDEELRGLYRDLVLVRAVDAEATALQRQGELGIWASLLGQEAAQVGSGRALHAEDYRLPDLPRARRRLVPRRRPAAPAGPVPRRRPRRLGPGRAQLPPVHDRHRRAVACTPPATRWASSATARRPDATPPSSPSSATAPPARATSTRRSSSPPSSTRPVVFFCQNNQWAICVPLERQSRDPAVPAGRRLRLPRRAGRRQRRPRRPRRHPGGAGRAPARARARRSSRPSPTGWARTPPPTTRPATGWPASWRSGSCATRSPGSRPTSSRSGIADAGFFAAVDGRGRRARRASCARAAVDHARPGAADDVRPRLRRADPADVDAERAEFVAVPRQLRGGASQHDGAETLTSARRSTSGLRKAMEDDPKVVLMGEDIGKLGGVFRVTDGLQKDFGEDRVDRHPARRVRHRRHRRRPGDARLPAGVRDPVRRVRLPGVRPDRHPGGQDARPLAGRASSCRSSSASRSAAASARSSTTASRPRPTSRTPPG